MRDQCTSATLFPLYSTLGEALTDSAPRHTLRYEFNAVAERLVRGAGRGGSRHSVQRASARDIFRHYITGDNVQLESTGFNRFEREPEVFDLAQTIEALLDVPGKLRAAKVATAYIDAAALWTFLNYVAGKADGRSGADVDLDRKSVV